MQFNPLFLPSHPVSGVNGGNNIKSFKNLKYLFADLIKVSESEKSDSEEFSSILNGLNIELSKSKIHNTGAASDFPAFSNSSEQSSEKTLQAAQIILSLLSVTPTQLENPVNSDNNFTVNKVDADSIRQLFISLINAADGKKITAAFIKSGNPELNTYGEKTLHGLEQTEITFQNVDDIIERLKSGDKILININEKTLENVKNGQAITDFPLNEKTNEAQLSELNTTQKIFPANKTGDTIKAQMDNGNKINAPAFKTIKNDEKIFNRLNFADKSDKIKFRINNSADEIVNIAFTPKTTKTVKNSTIPSVNGTASIEKNFTLQLEISDSFKNENLTSPVEKEVIPSQKEFSIRLKFAGENPFPGKLNTANHKFIIDNSIKNLLKNNDKIAQLRTKVSNIFKESSEIEKPVQPNKLSEKVNRQYKNDSSKAGSGKNKADDVQKGEQYLNTIDGKKDDNKTLNPRIKHDNNSTGKIRNSAKAEPGFNETQNKSDQTKNQFKEQANTEGVEEGINKLSSEHRGKINVAKESSGIQLNLFENKITEQTQLKTKNIQPKELLNKTEIIGKVTELVQHKNRKSIELKLNPPELGKMKVKVDYSQKKLILRMEVENESARQLINNNIDQLKQTINQNGVQLTQVYVSLSGGEQKDQRPSEVKKKMTVSKKEITDDSETEESAKMMGYNTYEYLI